MSTDKIIKILKEINDLLVEGRDSYSAEKVKRALHGNDVVLYDFLMSNDLWGGAGSIADQALIEHSILRKKLESCLIDLGQEQKRLKKTNARTSMWVAAFKNFHKNEKE